MKKPKAKKATAKKKAAKAKKPLPAPKPYWVKPGPNFKDGYRWAGITAEQIRYFLKDLPGSFSGVQEFIKGRNTGGIVGVLRAVPALLADAEKAVGRKARRRPPADV